MGTNETILSLPLLPMKNTALFPHLLMPLSVGRARSIAAVEAALATESKELVIVSQKDSSVEDPDQHDQAGPPSSVAGANDRGNPCRLVEPHVEPIAHDTSQPGRNCARRQSGLASSICTVPIERSRKPPSQ